MYRFKRISKAIFVLAFLCVPLFFAQAVAQGIRDGIQISLDTAVPSLFCFMIVSDIAYQSGWMQTLIAPISRWLSRFYRIDMRLVGIVILSMIGGYPVGARLLADLVQKNKLDRNVANKMLCYCINCGPAFLFGGVALPLFGNLTMGLFLFIAQFLAAIVVGFLLRFWMPKVATDTERFTKKTPSSLVVGAVASASKSMLMICACIILFSACIAVFETCGFYTLLARILKNHTAIDTIQTILSGLLEVTRGCSGIGSLPFYPRVICACIFTAFGGVCVHLQLLSILTHAKLSLKAFYCTRPIYLVVSIVITLLLCQMFPSTVEVFALSSVVVSKISSNTYLSSIFLLFLAIGFLLSFEKSVKIKEIV